MSTRNKRILVTLAIIVAALSAFYAAAPAIVSMMATRFLSGTIEVSELEIETVGFERIKVASIRVADNHMRLVAQNGEVGFELWPFRIREIYIEKASITTTVFSSGSNSEPRDDIAFAVPVGLPFPLTIEEFMAELDTPWGAASIPASIRTGPGDQGGLQVEIISPDFELHLDNPAQRRHVLNILDSNQSPLLTMNAETPDGLPIRVDGELKPETIVHWIHTDDAVPAGLKNLIVPYLVESEGVRFTGALQANLDFNAQLMGELAVNDKRKGTDRLFERFEIETHAGHSVARSGTSWTGSGEAVATFVPKPGITLTGSEPAWSWRNGKLVLDLAETTVEELSASADRVHIEASGLDTNIPTGEIHVEGVRTHWWPESLAYYDVSGDWSRQDSTFQAGGTGTGRALPKLDWVVQAKDGKGSVKVTSNQPLADLTSSLKQYTSSVARDLSVKDGNADGDFRIEWDDEQQRSIFSATIGPADLDLDEMEVRELTVRLANQGTAMDRISVDVSAPIVKLAAGTVAEIFKMKLVVAYPGIELDMARTEMFGGEIKLRPTAFDLASDDDIVLYADIDALSLEKVMALFELESTQLTGKVAGPVRVVFHQDRGIEINQGDLRNMDSGVLRFSLDRDTGMAAQLDNIAIRALADFQYKELNASVLYRPNGDYRIAARIVGSNPNVLNGHPIALNPTIEGNLPAVFRAFFVTGDFNRAIVEQLQKDGALSTPGEASSFQGD